MSPMDCHLHALIIYPIWLGSSPTCLVVTPLFVRYAWNSFTWSARGRCGCYWVECSSLALMPSIRLTSSLSMVCAACFSIDGDYLRSLPLAAV